MPAILAVVLVMMGANFVPSILTVHAEADPKIVWMDALSTCEDPTGSTTIKIWDTNNQWSIGKYQYQYKTWAKYAKQFGTTKENITDPDLQDKVTRYILDTKGWGDWYICGGQTEKKLGTYPK